MASPRRADVIGVLRKKAEALEGHLSSPPTRAAHDELLAQVRLAEGAPGETLAEGQQILAQRNDELRRKRNRLWAAGAGLFALGATCCFAGNSTPFVVGRLVGCMGGVGVFVAGSMKDDQIGRNRRVSGFLKHWENEFPKMTAAAPAGGGTLLRSTLTLAAPENMKSELLEVMNATEAYLAAQPPEGSVQAALDQVRGDRFRVSDRPGASLEEMRQLARADTIRAKKLSKQLLVLAGVGFAAGFAGIFLHQSLLTVPGVLVGMVTGVKSGMLGDNEGRNNALIGTLNRWELQLDGLKNVARAGQEVQGLADGLQSRTAAVEEKDGHVVLGGIRVPVRVRSQLLNSSVEK